jgi:GNAT superfamily N-acetyltransferase
MNSEIRPISAADYAVWLPLWQGYLQFYQSELPAEVSLTSWQRFLDPSEPTHAALAWRDGQAVGLVQWIFHRSNWSVEHSCDLQDLFVDGALRGAGIGRQLIEYVYAQAHAAGASRVHWMTHESNTDARQLYERIAERSGFLQYRKLL